jgi:chromosome segregation ATPase
LAGVADAIATAVAAEAEIARAAEKANADAIAAEVDRATAAEEAIAADLATLDAEVQEHEQVVSAALNDLNARMTTAEGSVADHETRLTQAETDIDALEAALAGKNVEAESTTPDYVTATAADNKVTVAATQKVIDAVALAETSVQEVTSDNTCLTAVKTGNSVALSLVWEEGSF